MKVTTNYDFPLQWDQYPTDRDLLEEALERIDATIKKVAESGGTDGKGSSINYDGVYGDPDVSVSDALDDLHIATNTFEIALTATDGASADEVLWSYTTARAYTLPENLTGSVGTVGAGGLVTTIFDIQRNGTTVGAVEIFENDVSFSLPTESSFQPGDTLSLVSTGVSVFDSVSVTLLAKR